jgi:hypothetical protein
MEMPKPGPQHEKLARLAGQWQGNEQLHPSPWGPGGPALGTSIYRIELNGFIVTQDYVEEKDGAIVFKGHGVLTIDPKDGAVLWYWFDTMGMPPAEPARGSWDGDTLTLSRSAAQGDARYTYTLQGDQLDFKIENRFAGQPEFTTFMSATYRRG